MPGWPSRLCQRKWSSAPVCWTSWKKHWRPFLSLQWKGITQVCWLHHLIFLDPVLSTQDILLVCLAFTVNSFCVYVLPSAMASQEEEMGQFETEQLEESTTSLVSSSTSAYSSFPVDVVVYVRVQVQLSRALPPPH